MSTSFKLSRRSSSLPDFAWLTASGGVSNPAVTGAEADAPGIFWDEASENESNRTSPGLPLGFKTVGCNGITGKQIIRSSIVDIRRWMKAQIGLALLEDDNEHQPSAHLISLIERIFVRALLPGVTVELDSFRAMSLKSMDKAQREKRRVLRTRIRRTRGTKVIGGATRR